MSTASDPQRTRWWAGFLVLAVILGGATWFAREHHATKVEATAVPSIALAIRKETRIGHDYLVAVRTVNLNANQAIEQANPSNGPPKGQYVIATLTAKHVGKGKGHPRADLTVTYSGSDGRNYDASTCSVDLGNAGKPSVADGGTVTYSVCFDLPEPAISGGHVGVAESASPNVPTYWEINN